MIVMSNLDIDLRNFLQQYHQNYTWKERIQVIFNITDGICGIHKENSIHRDLHSGNILYSQYFDFWYISDLGFCGPVDKPLGSIYGNLPYIAPEVIVKKEYTFASDIYSLAMLMWEVSSGQPPFAGVDHNYDLAMKIINGMRPKTIPGTPLEYEKLMKQCWDADPSKRLNIATLFGKFKEMLKPYLMNENNGQQEIIITNNKLIQSNTNSITVNSKIYNFKNLPEPKNATKGKSYNVVFNF